MLEYIKKYLHLKRFPRKLRTRIWSIDKVQEITGRQCYQPSEKPRFGLPASFKEEKNKQNFCKVVCLEMSSI